MTIKSRFQLLAELERIDKFHDSGKYTKKQHDIKSKSSVDSFYKYIKRK